jgi:hypothetical protein
MNRHLLALVLVAVLLPGCREAEWSEFTTREGGFSVLLPGVPASETRTLNIPSGPVDLHMFGVEQDGFAYMASYNDYPDELVNQRPAATMLDGARDGAVANVQGELLGESLLTIDGHPGREIKVAASGGQLMMVARIYLVGNRLYQAAVVTDKENALSGNVVKFLDSFRLHAS